MTICDNVQAVPDWFWLDGADHEDPGDVLTDWTPQEKL